jgi:hypothetical protein
VGPGERKTPKKKGPGTFRAPKFTKILPELDLTTKNMIKCQTLKNPINIAHSNSSKTAVFKLSKNFMARERHLTN